MKNIVFILLICFVLPVRSQVIPVPLEAHPWYEYQRYTDTTGTIHTSLRPEMQVLYNIHDLKEKKTKHSLMISPLANTGLNTDPEVTGNQITLGAGIRTTYLFKQQFAAFFAIMPVSTTFDSKLIQRIDTTGIIPHEGAYFSRNDARFNYLAMRGGINWKTASWFTLFAGYDKTFLGDGIRSLLWSHNAGPYWQLRATATTRKISYVVLYSFLHDDDNEQPGIHFQQKYSTAHYLNWNAGKRFTFSFYEAVVWRGNDSTAFRGYDVNYINPIVFFRPIEFNLGSPDNVILGMGGRIRLFKATHLYGQLVLDEFKLNEIKARSGWWANKYGLLAGIRTSVKLTGETFMLFQAEVSGVRPFTYSHISSLENLGNQMQPIAHPLGANFRDAWLKASYNNKNWTFSLTINDALTGTDSISRNMGSNIYRSYWDSRIEYGNTWLQGIPLRKTTTELKAAWWINRAWNLSVEGGMRFFVLQRDNEKQRQIQVFSGIVTRF